MLQDEIRVASLSEAIHAWVVVSRGDRRLYDMLVPANCEQRSRRYQNRHFLPLRHIESGTAPLDIHPLITVRYPKVRLRGFQVDTDLLPETVCRIDDAPHALLLTHLHELLPGYGHAGVRHDRIDDRHDSVMLALETNIVRQDVEVHGRMRGLERAHLGVKGLHDVCVRRWIRELECVYGRTRRLHAVGKVLGSALDGAVGHSGWTGFVRTGTSVKGELHTRENDIALPPLDVTQDGVDPVCGVRDEDNLVMGSPDEVRYLHAARFAERRVQQQELDSYRACSSMGAKVAR